MSFSLAASHAKGKFATDNIIGANAAAVQAEAKVGKEKVVNATIGAILDDEGVLACLPTVEKVFRALPTVDLVRYSPIPGQPAFLQAVDHLGGDFAAIDRGSTHQFGLQLTGQPEHECRVVVCGGCLGSIFALLGFRFEIS